MRSDTIARLIRGLWLAFFFAYLFAPLLVMAGAAFNASRFPTVTPWTGTTLSWFEAMWRDRAMWEALEASFAIGLCVVLLAVPVGTAAALLLSEQHGRARSLLHAVMVSPMLTPGVVIGIATLVFWQRLGIGGGFVLIVLAQASFIAAYVMLMVSARLQRFDRRLEEAALDLGASRGRAFRRILLPYLRPSLLAAAFIAFLQSFENYNTTLFVRGVETPLTVFIASKVRTGLTPAVNALGLVLILATVLGALAYEIARRAEQRRRAGKSVEG